MGQEDKNIGEIQQPKKQFYENCYPELIKIYRESINEGQYAREGNIRRLADKQIDKKNFLDAEGIILNDLFENDDQIEMLLKLTKAMSADKKDYSHLAPEIKNRIINKNTMSSKFDYFLEYLNIFKNDYGITKDEISIAQGYVDNTPTSHDYGVNKKISADKLNELISSLPISTNTKNK